MRPCLLFSFTLILSGCFSSKKPDDDQTGGRSKIKKKPTWGQTSQTNTSSTTTSTSTNAETDTDSTDTEPPSGGLSKGDKESSEEQSTDSLSRLPSVHYGSLGETETGRIAIELTHRSLKLNYAAKKLQKILEKENFRALRVLLLRKIARHLRKNTKTDNPEHQLKIYRSILVYGYTTSRVLAYRMLTKPDQQSLKPLDADFRNRAWGKAKALGIRASFNLFDISESHRFEDLMKSLPLEGLQNRAFLKQIREAHRTNSDTKSNPYFYTDFLSKRIHIKSITRKIRVLNKPIGYTPTGQSKDRFKEEITARTRLAKLIVLGYLTNLTTHESFKKELGIEPGATSFAQNLHQQFEQESKARKDKRHNPFYTNLFKLILPASY